MHLDAHESGVRACSAHEFVVSAQLGDVPVVEDDDFVRIADSGEAVRDNEGGAVPHKLGDGRAHFPLVLRIQVGRGFVQDQNRRLFQQSARNGKPLPLPAGIDVPRSPTTES